MEHDKSAATSQGPTKSNGRWQTKKENMPDQMIESAKQTYERIVDSASNSLNSASEALITVGNRASTMVRQYPIQTAVGALAVGFLLGSMFRRTRI